MPRESIDVPLFNRGIVTSPDLDDIPDEAAAYSLDVENNADDGKLLGRSGDTLSSLLAGGMIDGERIQRTDGKEDLIFHSTDVLLPSTDYLKSVLDIYGTPTMGPFIELPANISVTMAKHNQEVHVGLGGEELLRPRWVGYTQSSQFGAKAPDTLQYAFAELTRPGAFPLFSKIVVDAGYIYGIELDGRTIYKVDKATGEILSNGGDTTFQRLRSICDESVTHFWMFDAGASTNGDIIKVLKADLSVVSRFSLGTYTLVPGAYISDIIATDNVIWLAAYRSNMANQDPDEEPIDFPEKWLFRTPKTGTAVTNVTPQLDGTDTSLGSWVVVYAGGFIPHDVKLVETFPISLVKLSATQVG